MRLSKGINVNIPAVDMTPMIDVTFQLIIFFMLVINFHVGEQLQIIQLPTSELAKPAETPPSNPLTLHVAKPDPDDNGRAYVYFGPGTKIPIENVDTELDELLKKEKQFMELNKKTPADATIIVRGDGHAKAEHVQRVIEACQRVGYENFTLRAKAESEY